LIANSRAVFGAQGRLAYLTLWRLGGFGNFRKKKVFGCITNTLAPPPIALESCSTAQTDRPV